MRQAKLIKRGEQNEQKPVPPQTAEKAQVATVRAAIKTVRAWVKDHQETEPLNPRRQFAALFS